MTEDDNAIRGCILGTYPFYVFWKNQFHVMILSNLSQDFHLRRQVSFWEAGYSENLTIEVGNFMSYIQLQAIRNRVGSDFHQVNPVSSTEQLVLQLIVCRSVDNLLSYLNNLLIVVLSNDDSLLKRCLEQSPRSKKGQEAKSIASALEDEIYRRSKLGLARLCEYVSETIDLEIFPPTIIVEGHSFTDFEEANELICARHVLVHNHGLVDSRFVTRTGSEWWIEGETIELDFDWVDHKVTRLLQWATDIDRRAAEQFGLFRQAIPAWEPPRGGI